MSAHQAAGAMNPSPTTDEVAQWIVDYLIRNRGAADSPLGIQRWWLAPHYGEAPLDVVMKALQQLERANVVEQRRKKTSRDMPPLYGSGPALPARP
jgi:hypothetical protein